MSEDWTDSIATIGAATPLSVILHIGAGSGADLRACLETGAGSVIAVEPDPVALADLERAAAGDARVRVLPVAVTEGSAQRTAFHVYNMACLSGLTPPQGLEQLLPGLKETARPVVSTRDAADLLSECFPQAARQDEAHPPGLLIIDAPSSAAQVVSALISAGLARQFRHLLLRAPEEAYWPQSEPAAELLRRLEEAGYRVQERDDDDPDFPRLRLALDPLAEHADSLGQQNAALQQRVEELEAAIEEKEMRLQAMRRELNRFEGQMDLLERILLRDDG
jgi:FkbM family methyltransferase